MVCLKFCHAHVTYFNDSNVLVNNYTKLCESVYILLQLLESLVKCVFAFLCSYSSHLWVTYRSAAQSSATPVTKMLCYKVMSIQNHMCIQNHSIIEL